MGGNLEAFLFYGSLMVGFNSTSGDSPEPNSKVVQFVSRATSENHLFGFPLAGLTSDRVKSLLQHNGAAYEHATQSCINSPRLGLSFRFNAANELLEVSAQAVGA